MAVFCVNRSSTKFKETAKRLNIDSNQLELIVHEYINSVGEANAFPSDDYIQSKVSGKQTVVTPSVFKVWQQFYSTPQIFNSREELDKAIARAETIFDKSAIGIKVNNDGSYIMNVKQPVNEEYEKLLQDILDNAPRNEEGKLLAPNGKVSNLTERQYAQVRTKEFKDWFGDWEKLYTFNTDNLDTSRIEFEITSNKNEHEGNQTLKIYIKGQVDKGHFELVKDREYGQYSVHFKTDKAKLQPGDTKVLFEELSKAIPNGAIVLSLIHI